MTALPQSEPILTTEDRYLWDEVWTPALLDHAQTRPFQRHLQQARTLADQAIATAKDPVVMVSGGKDSTALGELLHELGHCLPHVSEKDDLDYPGEEGHIEALAARWQVPLTIVRPAFSLEQWLREHGQGLSASDDIHSRLSAFSQEGFYDVVERAAEGAGLLFLGLRKEESRARMRNRASRGLLYQRTDGKWVACPLGDWSGKDVLAYCLSRGVPLLPLYQCIAFDPTHRAEPWRIRKSWWLPGKSASRGGAAWLKRYYPSLFKRLCDLFPDARSMI